MSAIELYPLRFDPILKEKVWGGSKLHEMLAKKKMARCGESWELSAVPGSVSKVENGPLAGKDLQELVDSYKERLLGVGVHKKYGCEFPLLFKFIDARQDLSVQLHPDDRLARQRHDSYGKNEMWYVLQADPGARLILGFNQEMDKDKYKNFLGQGLLTEVLQEVPVKKGDAFYIRTGTVHAIGAGILLAEIQQTSDVTYRIYDWNRPGMDGTYRELHTDLALDAIDFDPPESRLPSADTASGTIQLARTAYFRTDKLYLDGAKEMELSDRDSFTVLMCVDGNARLEYGGAKLSMCTGETILLPACIESVGLEAENCTLLDICIP